MITEHKADGRSLVYRREKKCFANLLCNLKRSFWGDGVRMNR